MKPLTTARVLHITIRVDDFALNERGYDRVLDAIGDLDLDDVREGIRDALERVLPREILNAVDVEIKDADPAVTRELLAVLHRVVSQSLLEHHNEREHARALLAHLTSAR